MHPHAIAASDGRDVGFAVGEPRRRQRSFAGRQTGYERESVGAEGAPAKHREERGADAAPAEHREHAGRRARAASSGAQAEC
eukprot:1316559-Rhodomonas_salina.1